MFQYCKPVPLIPLHLQCTRIPQIGNSEASSFQPLPPQPYPNEVLQSCITKKPSLWTPAHQEFQIKIKLIASLTCNGVISIFFLKMNECPKPSFYSVLYCSNESHWSKYLSLTKTLLAIDPNISHF